ncbi:hypothetical protein SAMN04488004_102260 [Loktanella salsilacus]|uniref:Uncharacterized protein n=1 Tax=Loktanella salsilacus TaxID=195913 RepID=A0A1I4CQS2_9RHOB|nr:hypothetical protein SAMN04488004_102260 [Loktanella salsilacus]
MPCIPVFLERFQIGTVLATSNCIYKLLDKPNSVVICGAHSRW